MKPLLSLYIHIPFCIQKHKADPPGVCVAGPETRRRYLQALEQELEAAEEILSEHCLSSIFVGGGGSLLKSDDFARLLLKIKRSTECLKGMELSIRFLPETLISTTLSGLNIASFNRVSLEALCGRERDFQFLGSSYDYDVIEDGMNMLNLFKYPNCDVEILYGLPEQSLRALENTLCLYTNFQNVCHLTLRPYTGEGAAEDSMQEEQFAHACAYLEGRGFRLYGAGRFAKPGMECRFFTQEALGVDRLGLGAGAKSALDGFCYENTAELSRYLEHAANFEAIVENPMELDEKSALKRRLALRLQLAEAFDPKAMGFESLRAELDALREQGYIQKEADCIAPTLLALRAPERLQKALFTC